MIRKNKQEERIAKSCSLVEVRRNASQSQSYTDQKRYTAGVPIASPYFRGSVMGLHVNSSGFPRLGRDVEYAVKSVIIAPPHSRNEGE